MNYIMIAGNLGSDPEVRYTSSGQKVTSFRVASNSRKGGNDVTTWFRITVWGESMDKLIAHLKKGSSVMIYGELAKPEIYEDREGKAQVSLNVTAHHIAFSPFGKGRDAQSNEGAFGASQFGGAGQNGGSFQESTYQQAPAGNSQAGGNYNAGASPSGFSFGAGDGAMQGQNSDMGAFNDEEVPF